jgi:polygalacturonase
MDPFNPARRELLRFGGIGLAAAATTAVPAAYAAAQRFPNASALQGIFDIRTYGAVGDGKTVDSPAINKAIEAAAAAGAAPFSSPPEPGSASPSD